MTVDDTAALAVARPGAIKPVLAAETVRLYTGDWEQFRRYCAIHGQAALPAGPELVAAFLAVPGVGRAGLARRLAAIDHQHRQRGLPVPGADPHVRAVLRAARRAAPRASRSAPLPPQTLIRMAENCRGDLAGQRDRALLQLLAAGMSRSAIVALQAEQLRFSEAGLEMAGRLLARSASGALCPVRAIEDWLRVSTTRYGPVFRKVNRWGQIEHAALGADAIRLILTRRAAALPAMLSGARKRP